MPIIRLGMMQQLQTPNFKLNTEIGAWHSSCGRRLDETSLLTAILLYAELDKVILS